MNSHINDRQRHRKLVAAINWGGQFRVVERDAMPEEVALEMLCAPKARTTNRERKNWSAARATIFCSTRTAIPEEEKVSNKLKARSWVQLGKQLNRTIEAREKAQRHFLFLQRQSQKLDSGKKEHAGMLLLLERQMSALTLHAAGLDALRDAVETEVDRRKQFIVSLQNIAPAIASAIDAKLVGTL